MLGEPGGLEGGENPRAAWWGERVSWIDETQQETFGLATVA